MAISTLSKLPSKDLVLRCPLSVRISRIGRVYYANAMLQGKVALQGQGTTTGLALKDLGASIVHGYTVLKDDPRRDDETRRHWQAYKWTVERPKILQRKRSNKYRDRGRQLS